MGSNAKRKTTMAKLNRETRLREKRAEKQARKNARKRAAAEDSGPAPDDHLTGDDVLHPAGDVLDPPAPADEPART